MVSYLANDPRVVCKEGLHDNCLAEAQQKGFKLCLEEAGNKSSNDGVKFLWEEEIVVAL